MFCQKIINIHLKVLSILFYQLYLFLSDVEIVIIILGKVRFAVPNEQIGA